MVFTHHLLAKIFLKAFSLGPGSSYLQACGTGTLTCLGPGGSMSPPVFMGNVRHVLSVEIVC